MAAEPPAGMDHVLVAIVPTVARDSHRPRGGANGEELCRSAKVVGLGGRLPPSREWFVHPARDVQVAARHLSHGGPSADLRGTGASR
jgi:hypothetical protein